MSSPTKRIEFVAGQTFLDQTTWCQGTKVYKEVINVIPGLPTFLEVLEHGIPVNSIIPVWFDNFKTNSKTSFKSNSFAWAMATDENSLTLLDYNTDEIQISKYGVLWYVPPIDLTEFDIQANFRRSTSLPVLMNADLLTGFSLYSDGRILLELSPEQTRTLIGSSRNPVSGIAHVELTNADDQIEVLWIYEWTVYPEGTSE